MKPMKIFALTILICVAAFVITPAFAQTFRTYHCADGTQFIVGFYPYDTSAYVQIDGREITLPPRLTWSGRRYSAADVTLRMSRAGATTIRHARRREAACEVFRNSSGPD
jgi:membrane-bound inhibitor of C-type lysozyme